MLFLDDLFINLCVLIALIFIYLQVRWRFLQLEEKPKIYSIVVDGVAGGVLGFTLMNFSIQITAETIVDLRFIPVMLVILFIGVPQAIISSILIMVGRFLLGVTTSAAAAMVLMIALIIGFIAIQKLLKKTSLNPSTYQQGFLMIIFSNISFTIIMLYLISDMEILLVLIPSYWFISIIGGLIAIFFVEYIRKTQHLLMKYEKESTVDYLTGLNNVRQFDAIWNSLTREAKEKKEKLSLLIIDIDHFKHVNDTYGHSIGDLVLKELGDVLKSATRSFDHVSRNGGEEFSVILPDCPLDQAVDIAERIRKTVEMHEFHVLPKDSLHITVSIGVAAYPDTVSDTEHMVDSADECLYNAKRAGRNRVCDTHRQYN
ncbi:diguanylate cyclase [Alkalicoccus chagannorensis]